MQDLGNFVDFPSPPSSLYYAYGDSEPHSSEFQSPSNSVYDTTSAADSGISSRYPSPGHEEGDSLESTQQQKPAAKRKRENRYKNAPPAVLSRRRAQNRASQRAYRERKDQRIKDLEQMLNDAKQRNDVLSQAYAALHAEYVALKASHVNDPNPSYPQRYDLATYSGGASNMSVPTGAADGLDMNMFVYNDMNTVYSL
ncbi:AP-1-like transcription factor YAP1 [Achaetomium macrosporum]|uniref:Putative transcription factor kapC n=1 Tax=Achaetomium macrosporum TaxID=79813 RepID=A0AAN7HCN9_9PEZI|nr:AP-1-like transcription factor YAP1 [Achaetomium macrosporum]